MTQSANMRTIPKLDPITLRLLVAGYYREQPALREITQHLEKHGVRAWLFGGAIRDMVSSWRADTPMESVQVRDLDVVAFGTVEAYGAALEKLPWSWLRNVDDEKADEGRVQAMVEGKSGHRHTTVLEVEGVQVDLWHVEHQRSCGADSTPQDVADTTFLTIESVLARPAAEAPDVQMVDGGFIETMNSGVLGCRPRYAHATDQRKAAIKATSLAQRLGFQLDPDLRQHCADALADMTTRNIRRLLVERYGRLVPMPDLLDLVGHAAAIPVPMAELLSPVLTLPPPNVY